MARSLTMTLAEELKARAAELGFLACGITDPSPPPHPDRLDQWLAKGYAGTMRYLHRQAKRRKNPRLNVPESLAVVVLLENYYSPDAEADLEAPRVARYARGEDYHRVTLRRLPALGGCLRARGARVAHG
jgi:epoxyqueuosine reductase